MMWSCACGYRSFLHMQSCGHCGESRPAPVVKPVMKKDVPVAFAVKAVPKLGVFQGGAPNSPGAMGGVPLDIVYGRYVVPISITTKPNAEALRDTYCADGGPPMVDAPCVLKDFHFTMTEEMAAQSIFKETIDKTFKDCVSRFSGLPLPFSIKGER